MKRTKTMIEIASDFWVPKKIKSWEPYQDDMTGCIHWHNPLFKDVEIVATPNWADDGWTPFDLQFPYDDEYPNFFIGQVKNEQYKNHLRDVIEFVEHKFSK